jgi:pilus assembly protein CpaE
MLHSSDVSGARRPIRLLIVDDGHNAAEHIRHLLHNEPDVQVLDVATSGRDAIARAPALHPDIVLVDLNLRDMDGLQAAELIGRATQATLVVMSVQSDREYFMRAMMIGARGYLVKPFGREELLKTLRSAAVTGGPHPGPGSGAPGPMNSGGSPGDRLRRIITVYSPKGGAGRSVLAVNLAIALQAATRRSVALVDANLQAGDVHVLLNITSPTTIEDLREAGTLDAETIESALVAHEGSGIRVLRAPASPESAEFFTADAMKTILEQVRDHFDYVVIDTDTNFSEATLIALEIADQIVAITTLEVTTINRLGQFFDVAERLGYPRTKIRLVCNRVESYYGIRPAQVEARLRTRFVAQIPEDNKLVVASVNRGVPFVLSQRSAPISASVCALAQRLEAILDGPDDDLGRGDKPRRFGLF